MTVVVTGTRTEAVSERTAGIVKRVSVRVVMMFRVLVWTGTSGWLQEGQVLTVMLAGVYAKASVRGTRQETVNCEL